MIYLQSLFPGLIGRFLESAFQEFVLKYVDDDDIMTSEYTQCWISSNKNYLE